MRMPILAATPALHRRAVVSCMLLLVLSCSLSAQAQFEIIGTTPLLDSSGHGSTLLGTVGSEIPIAVLQAGTVGLLWGAVPSRAVIAACILINTTGQHIFTANISRDWGGSEFLTLQVLATDGCLAAGTQFYFVDNHGRYSALVCPESNASSIGCGVYMTGNDIDAIYNSWYGGSSLYLLRSAAAKSSRTLLGYSYAPILGNITGVLTADDCMELGPLAPFCVPGELGFARDCSCTGDHCSCSSCFPGNALVRTQHGRVIPMSQLQLGDQVAVWGDDGVVRYDDVYAFGHKDAEAISIFTKITVQPIDDDEYNSGFDHMNSAIRLSGDHFLPTSTSSAGNTALVYKRADDIQVGDIIWATYHSTSGHDANAKKHVMLPSRVKGVSKTWGRGLYNPLTLSGTIIVDDIVASAHSRWFLDTVFDTIGLPQYWLPAAYQFVLAPVRVLYRMMGKNAYIFLYDKLDAYLDIPEFGTNYGGRIALGACATLVTTVSTPLFLRLARQKP